MKSIFTNVVTFGDETEMLMENVNLCRAFDSGMIESIAMLNLNKSFTTPRKVVEDPVRYSVDFDFPIPYRDLTISVDKWGNAEVSTVSNLEDAVKSVGYIYHGYKQILDYARKNPVVAEVKPWLPAVDKTGTTLTDILNECKASSKMFTITSHRGKVAVKFLSGVKGTVKGELLLQEPFKWYRTVLDKYGFAVKLVDATVPEEVFNGDCSIYYTNDLVSVESFMRVKRHANHRMHVLVNNGNGTFYEIMNITIER